VHAVSIEGSVSLAVDGSSAAVFIDNPLFKSVMTAAIADMAGVNEALVEVTLRTGRRRLGLAVQRRLAVSIIAEYVIVLSAGQGLDAGPSVDSVVSAIVQTSTESFKAKMVTAIEKYHGGSGAMAALSFTVEELATPEAVTTQQGMTMPEIEDNDEPESLSGAVSSNVAGSALLSALTAVLAQQLRK